MAPSMAANINPQASAATAGRAVPLAFLIAAVGVLLVAYTFVRLCQYYHHSGRSTRSSGRRSGRGPGWWGLGLLGTYTFYAVVTSSAAGIFGTAFLNAVGVGRSAVVGTVPARRGGAGADPGVRHRPGPPRHERAAVGGRRHGGADPDRHDHRAGPAALGERAGRTRLHAVGVRAAAGTSFSPLFLAVVFGFLSFAGFEAAATLGEERPTRPGISREPSWHALFGGIYFVVVTAVEMMGFGTSKTGVAASPVPVAAGRPGHELRRGVDRRHHHPGHHHQRVRLLPGLHGGRVPADVRAGPGRGWAPRVGRRPHRAPPRPPW